MSLDGGSTWEPYIWTFGEIGVWTNWTWYQTTLDLSMYSGENIMVAFNIVADDNADIALDNIYLGDASGLMPKGTISRSSPCKADAKSKVATDCGSVNKPEQNMSRSVFSGYAVYRDGNKIAETTSTTYTDEDLAIGTYTYYVTAMFTSPISESGPLNEVEAEIINNPPPTREADIKRLPDGYSPTIDGQADILWNNVEAHNIDLNFTGEFPTLYDATWKAVWNDTVICVLVEVSEDSFWPSWLSGLADWASDKPEVYFDVNEILEDGLGPLPDGSNQGHFQFAPNFSETEQGTLHFNNGAYVADNWTAYPAVMFMNTEYRSVHL